MVVSENLASIHQKVTSALIIIVLFMFLIAATAQAQNITNTQLSTTDVFSIPERNGSVRFAFNGSYQEAKLQNNTWIFRGLELNNTQATAAYGFPDMESMPNLKISAQDCNVTVLGCVSFNYSWTAQVIMYTVDGYGTEIIDMGLNASEPTTVDEWSVLVDNGATFLAEGSGWNLLPDNSVKVNVGGGNVTVMHFDFNDPSMANLSFMMQHYVGILTGVSLVIVLVLAVVIAFMVRRRKQKLSS